MKLDFQAHLSWPVARPVLGQKQHILMLQGHPSGFWSELGKRLKSQGCEVSKIHFNLADRLFWRDSNATDYTGPLEAWGAWLHDFVVEHEVTDIIYYADRVPYHVEARRIADRLGLASWAVEFGYLRPDWLTLSPGGMGAHSAIKFTPLTMKELARTAPEMDLTPRYSHRFSTEAFCEVTYGLFSVFGWPLYPQYVSDRKYHPVLDYLSWLPKLVLSGRRKRAADRVEENLLTSGTDYNLVAMQIESDYQVRESSPFDSLEEFLEDILTSFKRSAPATRHLVIKLHPLDSGLERWFSRTTRLLKKHGLSERVHVIRGGDLFRLIAHSQGVVVVNSTVGLHALRAKVPVLALGTAVYDIPGLTHQSGADGFWKTPDCVEAETLGIFLKALSAIQIKGSFFGEPGQQAAAREIAKRLIWDLADVR